MSSAGSQSCKSGGSRNGWSRSNGTYVVIPYIQYCPPHRYPISCQRALSIRQAASLRGARFHFVGVLLSRCRRGPFSGLLPVVFALLLAPGGALLQIELAVVIGVDLVEAFAVDLVPFLGRHRRQLVVVSLAPLEARLFRCRESGGRQLPRQAPLALLQIVNAELAVLLKGDHVPRDGRLRRALRARWPMPPSRCADNGGRSSKQDQCSHRHLLGSWFDDRNKT